MLSFQQIILNLQTFWDKQGCAILQPYDMEMGAGTFHPATVLGTLAHENWNVAFVQPSRRPTDSRFGKHPSRMQHYYQFQVILKPSPDNIQDLYLESIKALGIDVKKHDIRFVEDDWESPTLGASGLGWEVWCNGMEVSQFTYMQQIAGIECKPVAGEITYGLERLALYIQEVDSFDKLSWNGERGDKSLSYGDIDLAAEVQQSKYCLEIADTNILFKQFVEAEQNCNKLVEANLPIPAYDQCIKASHLFNLLDSRGVISVSERASYIIRIRNLCKQACALWVAMNNNKEL